MGLTIGAGRLGEYKSTTVASGSATSLSTGTAATVAGATLSLQPGIWDITGIIDFQFAVNTSYTILQACIGTVDNTLSVNQDEVFTWITPAAVPTNTVDMTFDIPEIRVTVRTATTFYLVAKATFTVSTLKAYGTICARRVRD